MNNKGFTLVELLATLVILVSISLVAVGGITASLERRDIKECEEQKELAIGAAKIYFSMENDDRVVIGTLIDNDYFGNNSKINILKENRSAEIVLSGNQYVFNDFKCS